MVQLGGADRREESGLVGADPIRRSMSRLSVIEYGIGNIQSVVNGLRRVGGDPVVARDGAALEAHRPDKIVLPGVGAIGAALANLTDRGFIDPLERMVIKEGKPLLGICVGLQVLAESCEEFGLHRGLGWIPGKVARLHPDSATLRIPHVGWNEIAVQKRDPLLEAVNGEHFYFVHSFAIDCPAKNVIATCDYGGPFVCAVRHEHIAAVQFHPEKSSRAGDKVLAAFLNE
jgi:imidazole glycerol-phosphate synthase subunit HisH